MAGRVPDGIDLRALPHLTQRAQSAHRVAAIVTGIFVVAGMAWVFVTDAFLYAVSHDPALVARIETAKGWIFIGLAGLLLYAVAFRSAARLDRVRRLTAAIVESIADGVLLLGRDRNIAYANPAALRMLRSTREELVGMDVATFSLRFRLSYLTGGTIPPSSYISQRAFEEGGPLQRKAVLHPPGGGEVVISATSAGVRLQVGAPAVWVVSVMHDITDTERLERMRDQFFEAAAHALKTPVAVIKADVQGLLSDLTPASKRVTASIARQCDRIDRLVQNLLILARARSQTLELHTAEMELRPLIERISTEDVWSHRHLVGMEVTGSPSLQADRERIGLAIRNLLYEASRLSPVDSELTLLARPDGNRVSVGVRYHPIPGRIRPDAIHADYDDLGIGRSVAQTIVESHGGSLSDEDTETERTSWIHLPAEAGSHA